MGEKRIVAVNAGPRSGWNTDRLIKAAAEGAQETGASVEFIDLYKLEKYTGCISCFGCKQQKSYGKCVKKDGLSGVLETIRNVDGLIIGSPNYLGNLTASFRALYERLVFQSLTYNKETPSCSTRKIPVILIMTSNCDEAMYDAVGYTALLEGYRKTLGAYVGPTEILCCGNTLQVEDYSKYNWTLFDPATKKAHHDDSFADYLEKARELGRRL